MERNANYALVGAASLLLFIALIVFAFWLARISFSRDYDDYDVLFIGPVRGLSEGGEVHFNGIKVGDVTRIALDAQDPNRVIARIRVTSDVPIREDSSATLEPQGITGVNYIQITAGNATKRLLKDTVPAGQVPVIQTRRGDLQDLLAGGGTVLTRTIEALDQIKKVLSDENIATFSKSLKNVESVTTEMDRQKAIIAELRTAILSFQETAKEYTALAKSGQNFVDNDAKAAAAEIEKAAAEIDKAASDLNKMLNKLDGPVNDFATTGLPQITEAVGNLRDAAESLDRLAREVEKNPQGLVAKPPAEKKKVKP